MESTSDSGEAPPRLQIFPRRWRIWMAAITVMLCVLVQLKTNLVSLSEAFLYENNRPQKPVRHDQFEWSIEALLQRNVSSIFEVPDEEWPERKLCAYNVSIFVYEQLPRKLTSMYEDKLKEQLHNHVTIQQNIATEWALLKLFRSSPCRSFSATEADLILVPYMHFTHCALQEGYAYQCGQVPDIDMEELFRNLNFYNTPALKARHVFLNVYDSIMSKKQIHAVHLKLTSGPLYKGIDGPGSIIVPIFHADPRYQPSVMLSHKDSWWTRPRKYAFVAFFGKGNPRMRRRQPRRFREYFWSDVEQSYPGTIGGLPYISMALSRNSSVDIYGSYRDSVLCPILAGDTCWQRRFFDVIRNGCLPLVLEWPLEGDGRTWHTPSSCSLLDTYPFLKGAYGHDSSIEIDYDSFVVTAPGSVEDEANVTSLLTAMESLLANPNEVARRQRNMMAYAPQMTLGLGMDAHMYDDGFARIMRILQHHLRESI